MKCVSIVCARLLRIVAQPKPSPKSAKVSSLAHCWDMIFDYHAVFLILGFSITKTLISSARMTQPTRP